MNREMFEKTLNFIKIDISEAEFWQLRLLLYIYDELASINNWQERHLNMLTSIDEGQNILIEKIEQIEEKLKSLDDATDLIKDRVYDIEENTSK